MTGPLLLLVIIAAIVVMVKYQTQTKTVFAGVGKTAGGLMGFLTKLFTSKNFLFFLLAVGILILAFWMPWSTLESPSLSTVSATAKKYWLWILGVSSVLLLLTLLMKKGNEWRQALQVGVGLMLLSLFVVIPALSWIPSSLSSGGCVKGHPCVPSLYSDGSSSVVDVPKGKTACFDPWMWQRLDEVGLVISYQAAGVPKMPFPCSAKDVYGGNCTAIYDKFSFKPPQKTPLPNYWFVASGSLQC